MIRRRNIRLYKGEFRDIISAYFKGQVSSGDNVERFERKISSLISRTEAIATCSGRCAMELILESMGIGEADEVIVPAYTLKDLVKLMQAKGIHPVLADVDPHTFNIDPDKIIKKLTPRTKAIVAAHLFGVPCDIERIMDIASQRGIKVIEDCAHVLGAKKDGKPLGSFGDAAFFSFEVTKPINTFGGGMIVTDSANVAEYARKSIREYPFLRGALFKKMMFSFLEDLIVRSPLFGPLIKFITSPRGTKLYLSMHSASRVEASKYTDLQAKLALKQLPELAEKELSRKRIVEKLRSFIGDEVKFQKEYPNSERGFYFLVVKVDGPKNILDIRRELLSKGVDAGILQEITDNCTLLDGCSEYLEGVKDVYDKNLQLPLFDEMREDHVLKISSSVKEVLQGGPGE